MLSAYLTPSQAGKRLRLTSRTIRRRLLYGELAHLRLSDRVLRVEAAALDSAAPDPTDSLPRTVRPIELARWLLVSRSFIYTLISSGALPARGAQGSVCRRDLLRFIVDRTVEPGVTP